MRPAAPAAPYFLGRIPKNYIRARLPVWRRIKIQMSFPSTKKSPESAIYVTERELADGNDSLLTPSSSSDPTTAPRKSKLSTFALLFKGHRARPDRRADIPAQARNMMSLL